MYLVKYSIKRLLMLIPVILGVTLILYYVMALSPGNPALQILGADASPEQIETLEKEMYLDQPILVQYGNYIWNVLHFNFGTSWVSGYNVLDVFWEKLPNTLMLASIATLWAVALGIPIGIYAAVRQYSIFDYGSMVVAMLLFLFSGFLVGDYVSDSVLPGASMVAGDRNWDLETFGTAVPDSGSQYAGFYDSHEPGPVCLTFSSRTISGLQGQKESRKGMFWFIMR